MEDFMKQVTKAVHHFSNPGSLGFNLFRALGIENEEGDLGQLGAGQRMNIDDQIYGYKEWGKQLDEAKSDFDWRKHGPQWDISNPAENNPRQNFGEGINWGKQWVGEPNWGEQLGFGNVGGQLHSGLENPFYKMRDHKKKEDEPSDAPPPPGASEEDKSDTEQTAQALTDDDTSLPMASGARAYDWAANIRRRLGGMGEDLYASRGKKASLLTRRHMAV